MKWLNRSEIEVFLVQNGITSSTAVAEVLSGFDLDQPIYEQQFEEGQELFQFIRNPSASNSSPRVGSWFALPGATTKRVAIIDGGAGRRLHRFKVVQAFTALEGTAKSFPLTWKLEIGGEGGATQIYLPQRFIGHLDALSPAERA